MNKYNNIIFTTNSQKVLNFFLDHPIKEFVEAEIRDPARISRSGVNYALKELVQADFLFVYKKGKLCFYSLDYGNTVVKQFKVLKTVISLQSVLKRLKDWSSKIILFGSASRGEDFSDSDIDLYIISNNEKEELEKQIGSFKREIQLVVRTELGDTELKAKDLVFYEQVQKGIVLWEKR